MFPLLSDHRMFLHSDTDCSATRLCLSKPNELYTDSTPLYSLHILEESNIVQYTIIDIEIWLPLHTIISGQIPTNSDHHDSALFWF